MCSGCCCRIWMSGLTALLGSPGSAVSDAVREITPVLEGLRRLIKPAPITAATAQDLRITAGTDTSTRGPQVGCSLL
jgi:hypothetical protein